MGFTGRTRIYGVIGDPVSHSLSPVFWNAAFAALEMDAVYLAFPVPAAGLGAALSGMAALGFGGFNVTLPHKEAVAGRCSTLLPPADLIGAVNTVRIEADGRLTGANTDGPAIAGLLRAMGSPRRLLLLGAGGAARAVLWGFCQSGGEMVYWTNRTPTRLECPFSSFSPQLVKIPWEEEELRQTGKVADLIVNATSLGWRTDDELPWLGDVLTEEKTYFDLNYAAESRLLTVARASGATVFDGKELLLRQGMEGFRLVTGRDPPERAMRQSLADRLGGGS